MTLSHDERLEVIWKALREFDRMERTYRTMRMINKDGPTIKPGTRRTALARLIVFRLREAEIAEARRDAETPSTDT